MDLLLYSLGILFGLIAGIVFGTGTVMQKYAINNLPKESELMRSLVKNKLWVSGFLFQFIVGSIFLIISQFLIGPALTPGLTAVGLIVIAIGSVRIVGESLKPSEILGIAIMIIGIFLLSLSGLAIELTETNFLEFNFLFRAYLYSGSLFFVAGLFCVIQKKTERFRGILYALASGIFFSIENIWLGFTFIALGHLFQGIFNLAEIIVFLIACFFAITINIYGVVTLQRAFQTGQASNLAPIQTVPVQLTPILVYFFVFLLVPPGFLSVILMFFGIIFILVSSFLLGKRQAQLEEIQ